MKRIQPRFWGSPAVTWPRQGERRQLTLPGLDPLAERQLDADALREWMERMRAAELPELDEGPPDLTDVEGGREELLHCRVAGGNRLTGAVGFFSSPKENDDGQHDDQDLRRMAE